MMRETRMRSLFGWITILITALGVLAALGCESSTPPRVNAPPQGQSINPHSMQEPWVAMTDNAMLEERSMSSSHFIPNTPELNGIGVRRLSRYAELLKVYGGTLRYDGQEASRPMRLERVGKIEAFLLACGLEEGSFTVEAGVGGGTGMDATEASKIREATRGPGTVEIESKGGETTKMN